MKRLFAAALLGLFALVGFAGASERAARTRRS